MPQSPVLTPPEKRSAIDRLNRRIEDLRKFEPKSVTDRRPPDVVRLETNIEETLAGIFGPRTDRYNRYRHAADLEPPPIAVLDVPDWIAARGSGNGMHRGVDLNELRKQIADRKQRAIVLLRRCNSRA
jgi:ClpP class serine protease